MKASPEAQLRLLEVADIDAELGRIAHRRRGLPEHAEITRLTERDLELRDSNAALTAQSSDLGREQAKAEADVEQVRSRIERDRQRLDGGMVASPKELENLQSEIQSLQRRQSDLEEIVLDVMERRETNQATLDGGTAERTSIVAELQTVTAARDVALAELDEQAAKATAKRAQIAENIASDLLDLYDKVRAQHGGGVGAAALRARQCQGCNLAINTVDLNAIRAAADDEVLRCEECRRILVRTPESGL
ncbi:MAG TPA: C4-type zinc ribbon domain-containing protein [Streptosporangiaceae bacterium]